MDVTLAAYSWVVWRLTAGLCGGLQLGCVILLPQPPMILSSAYLCDTLPECVRRGDSVEVTSVEVTSAFESWRDATIVICM